MTTKPNATLSARELECFRLLSIGYSNAETAKHLGVVIKTVESHRARLFRKLEAKNGPDAVRIGFIRGYLTINQSAPALQDDSDSTEGQVGATTD